MPSIVHCSRGLLIPKLVGQIGGNGRAAMVEDPGPGTGDDLDERAAKKGEAVTGKVVGARSHGPRLQDQVLDK